MLETLRDFFAAAPEAALGNSTSTTLPASVDDHPDLLKHQRQRSKLAATLTAATDDVARCQRNRAQAERDVQEAEILRLLVDDAARATPEADARIIAADAAIVKAEARVVTISEALKRLDA